MSRHPHRRLLLILALGLVLRLGFVVYRQATVPAGRLLMDAHGVYDDQLEYDTTAWNIVAGNGFWSSDYGGSPYFSEPAYPLLVASIYAVGGHHPALVLLVQALLGTLSCYLLYRITRKWLGLRPGLLAALLLALHPNHIFYTAFLMGETLKVFMVILLILAVLHSLRRPGWTSLAAAGLAAGAAAMTRIVVLPYLVLLTFLYIIVFRGVRAARWSFAVYLLAAVAVLLPWSWRNHTLTGVFSPVHPRAGRMLAESSDPYSAKRLAHDPQYRQGAAAGVDQETRQAMESSEKSGLPGMIAGTLRLWGSRLGRTPGEALWLLGARFVGFWKLYPQGGPYALRIFQAYSLILNGGIFLLAALACLRPRLRASALAALLLLIGTFVAIHLLYQTVPMRYRMPIEPALIMLAAAGSPLVDRRRIPPSMHLDSPSEP
ncbi:MAG: glycosyltransferase family 39 protein [Acidobacteriota bacterium]